MTAISSITATSSHQSHIVDSHTSLQTEGHSLNDTQNSAQANQQKGCVSPDSNRNNEGDQPTITSSHTNCNVDVDIHNEVSHVTSGDQVANSHTGRKWEYTWTVQHFSVKECPRQWHHTLTLLLEYSKNPTDPDHPLHGHEQVDQCSDKHSVGETSNQDVPSSKSRQLRRVLKKDFSQCTYTPVPISLPLNCKNQHKHRWTVAIEGKNFLLLL